MVFRYLLWVVFYVRLITKDWYNVMLLLEDLIVTQVWFLFCFKLQTLECVSRIEDYSEVIIIALLNNI